MPTFRSSEFGWDLLRRGPETLISIVILEAAEGEVAYPVWQSITHTHGKPSYGARKSLSQPSEEKGQTRSLTCTGTDTQMLGTFMAKTSG